MMKKIIFIALLLAFNMSSAQDFEEGHREMISVFIDCIKSDHIDKLKTIVAYPLKREYPLPDIDDELEFEKRYHEIFDDSLKAIIISSDIESDWSTVGWRGIMLNHGTLWLDYDGTLKAVNYQSIVERDKRRSLIELDKNSIHESISDFEAPVLILETNRFRVRIDELNDGKLRYASWSIKQEMSEKPDLIIENGEWIPEGSGGNHRYEFINGHYKYECSINVLGPTDMSPAELSVYKDDEKILSQPGTLK